jgi:hypothetical protein
MIIAQRLSPGVRPQHDAAPFPRSCQNVITKFSIVGNFMQLRDHPLMSHRGVRNWPPLWTQMRIGGVKIVKGELGVLIYVHAGGASNTCYLVIEHENENYTGSLIFDDGPFCRQLVDLLQQYRGRSVKEIGDLQVSFTPE